jgi:hypothetical protein
MIVHCGFQLWRTSQQRIRNTTSARRPSGHAAMRSLFSFKIYELISNSPSSGHRLRIDTRMEVLPALRIEQLEAEVS